MMGGDKIWGGSSSPKEEGPTVTRCSDSFGFIVTFRKLNEKQFRVEIARGRCING